MLRNRNTNLEAEVTRRVHENALIENVTMHALTRLAQTRDNETGNHLRRTKEYVGLLARRLRNHRRFAHFLDERAIELLEKSAPLHDIGKVGIPDHILLKPGRHTPEERKVMRTHARLGAQAIEQAEIDAACPVGFLEFAKVIALHHHERWDGSGYPDGLAGDAIPIPARLMAIADVFDALVSRRPYKTGFDPREARRMIAAERGSHFDPDVTDAFLAGIADFEAIAVKYADGVDIDAADNAAALAETADAGHA
jgi:putative two-component system response regulator